MRARVSYSNTRDIAQLHVCCARETFSVTIAIYKCWECVYVHFPRSGPLENAMPQGSQLSSVRLLQQDPLLLLFQQTRGMLWLLWTMPLSTERRSVHYWTTRRPFQLWMFFLPSPQLWAMLLRMSLSLFILRKNVSFEIWRSDSWSLHWSHGRTTPCYWENVFCLVHKLNGSSSYVLCRILSLVVDSNRLFAWHGHVTLSIIKYGRDTNWVGKMERACRK